MAEQGTYTATNLPVDGTTIDAADVNTDLQGLIDEFNKQVPLSKISRESNSAWASWSPTYASVDSMTWTSVTTNYAKYVQIGRNIFFQIDAEGTTGGVASYALTFTLPVATAAVGQSNFAACVFDAGPLFIAGYAAMDTLQSSVVQVRKYDASNYGLGANRRIRVSGVYEVAA